MKLRNCIMGMIVTDGKRVGMIVGITTNAEFETQTVRDDIKNAIPLVQWSGRSQPCGVHQGNLEIYKGSL